jgi:hypothetical protein
MSIRSAKARNAHRVGLLITVAGEGPAERCRNVTVDLRFAHAAVGSVMFHHRFPTEMPAAGHYTARLGDLDATAPQPLGLSLFVTDLDALGPVHVADVLVSADVLVGLGTEHRRITVPIVATLDGQDHVEPTVEQTLVHLQAARAHEDAIQQADAGNFDGAANTLRVARDSLSTYARPAEIAKEMADLAAESMRLARRETPAPGKPPDAS